MSKCCSFVAAFVVSLAFSLLSASAQTPVAKIVIMMDLTGSTSATDLEIEKNAARSLLTTFSSAPAESRPYVAIGSFRVTDFGPAMIIPGAELTNTYGSPSPASGLYQVIDSIVEIGGYTDLAAAINVAQGHLNGSSVVGPSYIVFISDGTPNRPGAPEYTNCDECGCEVAYAATNAAATAAEQLGTKIFGIHYAGNGVAICQATEPARGMAFMRQDIATNPAYYYQGNGDLSQVFSQVSCAISCDDSNPCTRDTCNEATGACEYSELLGDIDGDSVVDCQDRCVGNDALLGTSCSLTNHPNPTCHRLGSYVCSSQGSVACVGSGVIPSLECFGCATSSVLPVHAEIRAFVTTQEAAVQKLARALKRHPKAKKAVKKSAKQSGLDVVTLRNGSIAALEGLPQSVSICTDTVACPIVNDALQADILTRNSDTTTRIGLRLYTQLRRTKSLSKALKKIGRSLSTTDAALDASIKKLPSFHNSCG